MARQIRQIGIRAKITTSGIWTIDDDDRIKSWMGDLRTSKGALWIHRYGLAHQAISVYLVKRRSRFVRTKDWLISYWMQDKLNSALTLVAMALVPLWVLLSILGL